MSKKIIILSPFPMTLTAHLQTKENNNLTNANNVTRRLHMALSHLIKDGDHWMIWHGPVSDSRIVLLCRLSIKSDSNYVICWRWVIGFEVSSYYHCTAGDRQDTNEYVTRSKTINSNTRYLYLQRQHWRKVVSG